MKDLMPWKRRLKWVKIAPVCELPPFGHAVLVAFRPKSPTMDGKLLFSVSERVRTGKGIALPPRLQQTLEANNNFKEQGGRVEYWAEIDYPV